MPQTDQVLSNDELDGISAIVNEDNRWQWSQSGSGREGGLQGGGRSISRDEVIRQKITSDGRVVEEEVEPSEQVGGELHDGIMSPFSVRLQHQWHHLAVSPVQAATVLPCVLSLPTCESRT